MKALFSFLLILLCYFSPFAQAPWQYVVTFKDKGNSPYALDKANEFLSDRSIKRRQVQGIAMDASDLPISPAYISEIRSIPSVNIRSKSKWFNDVVIEVTDTSIIDKISTKSFVSSIERIPGNTEKSSKRFRKEMDVHFEPEILNNYNTEYGAAYRQLSMLNGDYLHLMGNRGEGMRIAIIDGGFIGVPTSRHFEQLVSEGRIIDVYDFVDKDREVYQHATHGNFVLSTMASYIPNTMIGSSPFAEFVLLRSEDGAAEYLLEEFFWTEAAEFADSAGVDIINTSLGYTQFDDSLQDHTWLDLDGKTTRITRSANLAFKRGMLLFNSAGNSGNNGWQKISAPADAEMVIAVGAVDSSANLASFSSRGPTADNRIKPDVMAMGNLVYIGLDDGSARQSNGTSFSSPLLTGAVACLWQANRTKNWKEVREALLMSADRYESPDTNYGYGIPDLIKADAILKGRTVTSTSGNESVLVYPNPFTEQLSIVFNVPEKQEVQVNIYNELGQEVRSFRKTAQAGPSAFIYLGKEISDLNAGVYVIRISAASLDLDIKAVKL